MSDVEFIVRDHFSPNHFHFSSSSSVCVAIRHSAWHSYKYIRLPIGITACRWVAGWVYQRNAKHFADEEAHKRRTASKWAKTPHTMTKMKNNEPNWWHPLFSVYFLRTAERHNSLFAPSTACFTIQEIIIFHEYLFFPFLCISFAHFHLHLWTDLVPYTLLTMKWNSAYIVQLVLSLLELRQQKGEREKKTISWQQQQRLVNCDPWPSRARLGLPFSKCCVNDCGVCAHGTHRVSHFGLLHHLALLFLAFIYISFTLLARSIWMIPLLFMRRTKTNQSEERVFLLAFAVIMFATLNAYTQALTLTQLTQSHAHHIGHNCLFKLIKTQCE